jgi:hypothetical protein
MRGRNDKKQNVGTKKMEKGKKTEAKKVKEIDYVP